VDITLTISQHYALVATKAESNLCFIRQRVTGRLRKMILLLYSAPVRQIFFQFWLLRTRQIAT